MWRLPAERGAVRAGQDRRPERRRARAAARRLSVGVCQLPGPRGACNVCPMVLRVATSCNAFVVSVVCVLPAPAAIAGVV